MQNTIFWLTGAAFFAVQLTMLLSLVRRDERSAADPAAERRRRVEIVWTLVPASLIAALALMIGGLTRSPWTRTRTQIYRVAMPAPAAAEDATR